nr:uncharacterized protein LOC128685079 isoform X1 [Cherax quadricarinatus]
MVAREMVEGRGPLGVMSESLTPFTYLGEDLGGSPMVSPRSSPRASPRSSPRVSPRASPRVSPRSTPRRRSRALSREITPLEELIVVSVPCRELKVENVRLLDRFSNRKSTGTLYLTATHLIFVDPDAKKETWVSVAPASPQESCMNVLLQQGRCVNV